MYTLERRGYGEFAHGTIRELFRKARHEAREIRRSYTGTGYHEFEKFRIRDEHGITVAIIVCRPTGFEKEDVCKRMASGRALYRYYFTV